MLLNDVMGLCLKSLHDSEVHAGDWEYFVVLACAGTSCWASELLFLESNVTKS